MMFGFTIWKVQEPNVNNDLVKGKVLLIGFNTIRIGTSEYQITTDKDKFL